MIAHTLLALILRVGGTVVWLLVTIFLARTLSQSDFGLVFYVVNIITIGGVLGALGYDMASLRHGAQYWKDQAFENFAKLLMEAFAVCLCLGLLAICALVIGTLMDLQTPVTQNLSLAIMTGLGVFLAAILGINRDALRASDRLQAGLIGESLVRTIAFLMIAALLWSIGYVNAQIFVIGYVLALLLAVGFQARHLLRLKLSFNTQSLRLNHIGTALQIWPGSASNIILMRGAGVIVGLDGNLEGAALFFAADRIAQLGTFLISAVRTVSAPIVARASNADLSYQISRASLLVAGAGVMGSALLGVFGWMFLWLLGDTYTSALPVLLILLLGQVSLSVSGPVQLICNMRDLAAPASLLTTIVAVVMILFLIPLHSPIEAAMIVALSMWALNGGLWVIVYRKLGVVSGIFSINKKVLQSEKSQLGADIQKLRQKL